jgi:beta-mannosidase
LHYYAKKFFNPVLVSPVYTDSTINLYVVSELIDTVNMVISADIIDFKGVILNHVYVDARIEPLKSKIYCNLSVDSIKASDTYPNCILECRLISGDSLVSRNLMYFNLPKHLDFPADSNLKISVANIDSTINIILSSDVLIRNLYLYNDTVEGHFSDNYFDMLPGEQVNITFKSPEKIKASLFRKNLRYLSLGGL